MLKFEKKKKKPDTILKLLQRSHYKAFYFSPIQMLSSHQLRNNVKPLLRHRHLCHITTFRYKLARNLDCQGQAAIFKHSQGAFSREITHMLLYANKNFFINSLVIYSAEKSTSATQPKINENCNAQRLQSTFAMLITVKTISHSVFNTINLSG